MTSVSQAATGSGTQPWEQSAAMEKLVETLSEPNTAEALTRLASHADLLAFLVDALDGAFRRSDTIIESVADGVHELGGSATTLQNLATALPKVTGLAIDAVNNGTLDAAAALAGAAVPVLHSGMLEPALVSTLADAGKMLSESYVAAVNADPKPVGMRGLVGALRDPDVRKGLGFAVEIARQVGKRLPASA